MANTLLRWAGSKRQHVPFLRQFWSAAQHKRYVEPFAGSAALFFAVEPARALLGDLNGELIDAYKALRADPVAVHDHLGAFPRGKSAYLEIRAARRPDPAWRAARFIYLNRFCFNGLYRTNFRGEFNVPYGAPRNNRLPDQVALSATAELLGRAQLVHADFRASLARVKAGDFVYLDPPYAMSRRRVFVEYGRVPFSISDLADLADLLDEIDRRGASFVLSYADGAEARSAFGRWKRRRFLVRRNVAGFSAARRNQYELFASNIASFDVA
jgi:DNA adenine methylase